MFVAKMDQTRICTLDLPTDALRTLRQQHEFVCPCCHERVTLKIGRKKRPHFAHRSKTCTGTFSEGETVAHAEGKAQLYAFFQQKGLHVQLEPYLELLQQRPDLLVEQYAVEFQCSAISSEHLYRRTAGYKQAGYVPIWIPYARHKRAGWQLVSFNQLEQQCLQQDCLPYCMAFSPEEGAFIYYSYCMQMSATMFYTYIERVNPTVQHFPFYVPKAISYEAFLQLCDVQQRMRQRSLLQRLRFSKDGVQDTILRVAYTYYRSIVNVPHYVGIYVPHAFSLPMAPIDWQLYYVVWQQQYQYCLIEQEHHFCTFSSLPPLTDQQREAVRCYAAIVEAVTRKNVPLFSAMYDKIVAHHAQN